MRLIKLKEVLNQTGLGRSTLYSYVQQKQFPQPVSLGPRAVAWVESEVQSWIDQRVQLRDEKTKSACYMTELTL